MLPSSVVNGVRDHTMWCVALHFLTHSLFSDWLLSVFYLLGRKLANFFHDSARFAILDNDVIHKKDKNAEKRVCLRNLTNL